MAQSAWVRKQREIERARQAAERDARARLREQARAQRELERQQARADKERQRLYAEARLAEADEQNEELRRREDALSRLLRSALSTDSYVDFESLKVEPTVPEFSPGGLERPEPTPEYVEPPRPSWFMRILPGDRKSRRAALEAAKRAHAQALREHAGREDLRVQRLGDARAEYEARVRALRDSAIAQSADVDAFRDAFERHEPEAVANYFSLVLASSQYPDEFPSEHRVAFVLESKQLVVEYDLPPFEIVPATREYRYVKNKDEIAASARPASDCRSIYASVVAQVALRVVHELFQADRSLQFESVVLNAYVDTIDKRTGKPARPCLVTLRTTRDAFLALDLHRVDPQACLQGLNASVSKSPSELAPVRPVLEFNMVDPRFIEETDVISTLDQRPNLMELTPSEFENLITNLFEKMGLETRLTQASRDGGVDCVAYDPRPILGGKVVIQAKRYKHTVGVSAVRDLFGTMQNEGASKGILVTTSGYGKASWEFAEGKPLELLSGSNLLFLLHEHAGLDAKIEPPEDWVDPAPDSEPADIPASS